MRAAASYPVPALHGREFHIVVRRVGIDPSQDGLVFRAFVTRKFGGVDKIQSDPADRKTGITIDDKKILMLSHNVHLMESVERVIPSVVWSETFDSSAVLSGKPLYLFKSSIKRINKIANASRNGEINVFYARCAVALGQRNDQQVEAAADAVYDSPSLGVDKKRG